MTREEAINILWMYDVNFEPHPAEEVMHAIDMAIEALRQPERKTGRWITHKIKLDGVYRSYCECTACGHTRPTTLFPLYYCPNCGAKMEGDT